MTTPVRLVTALAPRNPETQAVVTQAVERLADQISPDQFDLIVAAAEHPAGVTTHELARLAGITRKQADHWTEMGWLTAQQTAPGSGHPRRYSSDQIAKATVMGRLKRLLGIEPEFGTYEAESLLIRGRLRVGDFELTRRTR